MAKYTKIDPDKMSEEQRQRIMDALDLHPIPAIKETPKTEKEEGVPGQKAVSFKERLEAYVEDRISKVVENRELQKEKQNLKKKKLF